VERSPHRLRPTHSTMNTRLDPTSGFAGRSKLAIYGESATRYACKRANRQAVGHLSSFVGIEGCAGGFVRVKHRGHGPVYQAARSLARPTMARPIRRWPRSRVRPPRLLRVRRTGAGQLQRSPRWPEAISTVAEDAAERPGDSDGDAVQGGHRSRDLARIRHVGSERLETAGAQVKDLPLT
jgi:hypothetical protein